MFPTASLAGRTQGPACSRITQICLFLQALNEEIVNRKKNVDQAIRNGQALLKQTTGNTEEMWEMWGVWESILHMPFLGKSMLCWVEAFLPQVFISFWKLPE